MARQRWLVIDTDAGVDDAVALCLALRCAARCGFELKLITTTYDAFYDRGSDICCNFSYLDC
jgi:inosine-uridine nucleoside N-ribohydrolase